MVDLRETKPEAASDHWSRHGEKRFTRHRDFSGGALAGDQAWPVDFL